VFVLKRLDQEQIEAILTRALEKWRGEENQQKDNSKDKDALKQLAVYSDGDGIHTYIYIYFGSKAFLHTFTNQIYS
jgi:replication-associated recombination protein RarA